MSAALKYGFAKDSLSLPEADTIYANAGDDVVFGDDVDIAGIMAKNGGPSDPSEWAEFIQKNLELFDFSKDKVSILETNNKEVILDQPDNLYGGSGNDILYGQGGTDLLFGDADDIRSDAGASQNLASLLGFTGGTDNVQLSAQAVAMKLDSLDEKAREQFAADIERNVENGGIEKSTDGNDKLFGGNGDDVLFGGGGNDVLVGGAGEDYLFGGSGNDVLVYDSNDKIIHGGEGIDIFVAGMGDGHLEALANVKKVEVMIKTDQKIDNLAQVAAAIGITVTSQGVAFDTSWTHDENQSTGTYDVYTKDGYEVEVLKTPSSGQPETLSLDESEAMDTLSSYIQVLENGEESGNDLKDGLGRARAAYRPQPENTEGEDSQADTFRMDLTGHNVLGKGTDGDDVLAGGEEYDVIFGDAGDDLIFMDSSDFLVDGGDGLDIILVGNEFSGSLDEMLQNYADNKAGNGGYKENMPMVNDVEVMIKGIDARDINSMEDLKQFGIEVEKEDGKNNLKLKAADWKGDEEGKVFTNESAHLTLETNNLTDISSTTGDVEIITLQMTFKAIVAAAKNRGQPHNP